MNKTKVYVFVFTHAYGQKEYRFPSHSKQMAWIEAASYVACHIMNPPVESIKFVEEVSTANPN